VGVSLLAGLVICIFYATGGLPGCKSKPEGLGKGAAIEEADGLALHWQHKPGRSAVYGLHRCTFQKKVAPLDPGGARKHTKFIASEL
jgi:hypothetical protein